jgi:hypothetical protein
MVISKEKSRSELPWPKMYLTNKKISLDKQAKHGTKKEMDKVKGKYFKKCEM